MQELQNDQIDGSEKMVTASDGKTQIRESEKHLVHIRKETPLYNSFTGQKLSTPSISTFTPQRFKEMEASNAFSGYTVDVLNMPGGETPTPAASPTVQDITFATALEIQYKELYGESPDPLLTPLEVSKKITEKVAENAVLAYTTRMEAEKQSQPAQFTAIQNSAAPVEGQPDNSYTEVLEKTEQATKTKK